MKILALCLALMLMVCATNASAQALDLALGTDEGAASESVSIPITLTTNGTSPSTITINVNFDSSALSVSNVAAGAAATSASKDVSYNVPSAGLLKIVIAGLNTNTMSDGVVATIQFAIKAAAATGASTLSGTATASDPSTPNPVDITANVTNGSVTVTTATTTGSLTVTISPSGAVSAGAKWAVDGGTWRNSGATVSGLSAGSHTVTFNSVSGYTKPADKTVTIVAGETTTASGTYTTSGGGTTGGCGKSAKSLSAYISEEDLEVGDAKVDVTIEVEAGIDNVPSILAKAASPVYRIGPSMAFAEPLAVLIPVTAGVDPDSLSVYYFSDSPEHNGWYPGENVVGWIVPDSQKVVEENGATYVYFEVNHSGVVQLGVEVGVQVAGVALDAQADHGGMTWSVMIASLCLVLAMLQSARKTCRVKQ